MSRSFVNITFYGAENSPFKSLFLIYLSTRKKFRKIMQHMVFNEI